MSNAFEMIFHTLFNGLYRFFVDSIRFAMEKCLFRFFLKFSFLVNIKRCMAIKIEKSHNRWFEKPCYMENSF